MPLPSSTFHVPSLGTSPLPPDQQNTQRNGSTSACPAPERTTKTKDTDGTTRKVHPVKQRLGISAYAPLGDDGEKKKKIRAQNAKRSSAQRERNDGIRAISDQFYLSRLTMSMRISEDRFQKTKYPLGKV